ncbi:DNA mismatch repair protein MutS [Acidipila sp. EB88]|nr:DNA mismatch repair protein MutS [Acidipila sp. EB88]
MLEAAGKDAAPRVPAEALPLVPAAAPSWDAPQTPLMRQYAAAKQQNPDALLFFRLGDFYELFYEDARVAARELGITLTSRDRERGVPMCGVPFHAADAHIARLLRRGFRIAVCEQMADPKQTKGIVPREVTRVLSPGTVLDHTLDAGENNFLAAIHVWQRGAEHARTADAERSPDKVLEKAARATATVAALALLDLSTGEFRTSEWSGPAAIAQCADALANAGATEVLLAAHNPLLLGEESTMRALERIRTKTTLDAWVFTADYALPLLEKQLSARSLEGFGLAGHTAAAIAAGAVLHYAQSTQRSALQHIDTLRFEERSQHLQLDAVSVRNLELLEPLFRGANESAHIATLAHTLDCCQTPMGKRLLRATILRPLADPAAIRARYAAVAELRAHLILREELRRALGNVLDLERLLARVALENAGPRDLLSLGSSLRALPSLCATLQQLQQAPWSQVCGRMHSLTNELAALEQAISTTLVAEPPVTIAEGGVIAPGVHAELDTLRTSSGDGRSAIVAIEERERARTGVASLKVRYTSVFGYYLELTRANLRHVPADYERKQTLVNAERFTTPELKELEHRILSAHDRSVAIEKQLFADLRASVLTSAAAIRSTSTLLAEIDLLANFAHLAAERDYCQPVLVEGEASLLEAAAARHPVIESIMQRNGLGRFTPNDVYLDSESSSILLITGPNMGGKSTYLRQAALLVILAQMGCFVPATSFRYSLVDRVYTRIGASDNVAQGRSTFMVEMTETATILNTATARSLVLLDEMGRGTATFDGLALAWSVLEHIHNTIHARTLFATHYHELTNLATQLPHLRNVRVSVKETPDGIVFLHAIEPGAANKSYGIDVARLAGVPQRVLARARQVLRAHERAERHELAAELAPATEPLQLTMFTPLSQRIVDRIESTEIDSLTPLQALNLLQELQEELRISKASA